MHKMLKDEADELQQQATTRVQIGKPLPGLKRFYFRVWDFHVPDLIPMFIFDNFNDSSDKRLTNLHPKSFLLMSKHHNRPG